MENLFPHFLRVEGAEWLRDFSRGVFRIGGLVSAERKNRGWVLAGASSRGREHSDLGLDLGCELEFGKERKRVGKSGEREI
jgi:hypothetical protein